MSKYLTEHMAREQKYRPMTNPYLLPHEADMLDGVVNDMESAMADYALVEVEHNQVEVWRK